MSIRDNILGSQRKPDRAVEVPEWGVTVYVKTMSSRDRDSFEQENADARDKGLSLPNFRARFLVRVLVDEKGVRIFGDADADALGEKDGTVLGRLFDATVEHNALDNASVEKMAKN
jgi:hypothetical protein